MAFGPQQGFDPGAKLGIAAALAVQEGGTLRGIAEI
jgi:hypothetical protein